jgi:outer membrane receptor protein involved in Fe transport
MPAQGNHERVQRRSNRYVLYVSAATIALVCTTQTNAQTTGNSSTVAQPAAQPEPEQLDAIVVTARRRAETVQDAPVPIYALGVQKLNAYSVNDLASAAKLTPGLLITRSTNNGGANLYLRGVGSSFISASFDQAVAVNIDNVPISKGRAITQSFFDMQQVEVLRGPQALFFGKNSTAGVVSVSTANPTDKTEFLARGGYEFGNKRFYGEAVASGPLSDVLGVRLALNGSTSSGGFFKNNSQQITGIPHTRNTPQEDELGGRLTLLYKPSDRFSLNVKLSADGLRNDGPNAYAQLVNCQGPGGTPQPVLGVPNVADCRLDRLTSSPSLTPSLVAGFRGVGDGHPFTRYSGRMASATATYSADAFTLTSVTGYYRYHTRIFDDYDLGSAQQIYGYERSKYSSFTQELRLATKFDGPFNITTGLFFDDTKLYFARATRLGTHPADPLTGRTETSDGGGTTRGNTYSGFAELILAPTPKLELSGGARFSREVKNSALELFYANPSSPRRFITSPVKDRFADNNVSFSGTARWKPTNNVTLFASYKEGYKSGGSNLSETPSLGVTAQTIHYESEGASGGEAGAKLRLLNDHLFVGLTAYRYDFKNLQYAIIDPVTLGRRLGNVGNYRAQGVELDLEYTVPSIDQLRLTGSVYYNHGRYTKFVGPCYTGQTIAQGCNLLPNAAGAFTSQNFEGRASPHAPDWNITGGVSYDFAVGGLMAGVNTQARYNSKYYLQETLAPTQLQDGYVDLSASVRLYEPDQHWELALIGRNLTDKLVGANAIDNPGTGGGTGTAVGKVADTYLIIGRPREVSLQLSVRF